MRKLVAMALLLSLCLTMLVPGMTESALKVNINISKMNSVLTYATVKSIIDEPAAYVGRRIKVDGYYNEILNVNTGEIERSLIVVDMMACCYTDGATYLGMITDVPENFIFPENEQKFTLIGVVEEIKIGPVSMGVVRIESITLQDHWAAEIKWG